MFPEWCFSILQWRHISMAESFKVEVVGFWFSIFGTDFYGFKSGLIDCHGIAVLPYFDEAKQSLSWICPVGRRSVVKLKPLADVFLFSSKFVMHLLFFFQLPSFSWRHFCYFKTSSRHSVPKVLFSFRHSVVLALWGRFLYPSILCLTSTEVQRDGVCGDGWPWLVFLFGWLGWRAFSR